MLYETQYVWFIFVSSMDLMMTWIILYLGGWEANPVARHVLDAFGMNGMVVFKMSLVVLVIVLCEWVGRKSHIAGKRLAIAGVVVTCIPVILAFLLLFHKSL